MKMALTKKTLHTLTLQSENEDILKKIADYAANVETLPVTLHESQVCSLLLAVSSALYTYNRSGETMKIPLIREIFGIFARYHIHISLLDAKNVVEYLTSKYIHND
jgi:hypothetical protein